MHVGIIGAGAAGLSCGWFLKQLGVDFTLIEASPRVGGLARSFEWHGFSCDIATHRLFSTDPRVLEALTELTPMHRHKRRSQIYFNKTWMRDPLDVLDLIRSTDLVHTFDLARSYYAKPRHPDPRSFRDFVEAKYGHALYDFFFRPYTEKLFGIPGDDIAVGWAQAKVRLAGPFDRLKKRSKTKFDYFYYPRNGGYGAICNSLYAEIAESVTLSSRVTQMDVADGKIAQLTYETDGTMHSLPVDAVIATTPVSVTANLLGHKARLAFRPMHAVYLLIGKPRVSGNHWVYFMDDDIAINRMVEFKNMSAEGTPDQTTVLCAEITDANADLVETAVRGLEKAGLLAPGDVLDSKVVTEPFAYPVYSTGYEARLAEIESGLARNGNLFSIGRAATFTHHEVDDNFGAARICADDVAAYLADRKEAAA